MALRTLLATVDETLPVLPASTHREVGTAHVLLSPRLFWLSLPCTHTFGCSRHCERSDFFMKSSLLEPKHCVDVIFSK